MVFKDQDHLSLMCSKNLSYFDEVRKFLKDHFKNDEKKEEI